MSKRRFTMAFVGAMAPILIVAPVAAALAPDPGPEPEVSPVLSAALAQERLVPRGYEIPFEAFAFEPGTTGEVLPQSGPRARQAPLGLWGEGSIVATVDVPTPTNRLRIRARADNCEGSPRMVVEVDGRRVLATRVSTNWDNSTFIARGAFAAGEREVRIRYLDDLSTDTCDRNLKIGEVGFFPGPELRLTSTPLRGTDFTVTPGAGSTFRYGPFGEPGLVLWDDGSASATAATLGATSIVVGARADECEGAPRMQVLVNGRTVIDELVATERIDGREVTGTYTGNGRWFGGTQHVEVRFVNDLVTPDCDRNLKVEHVTFIGTK
jgi:hypothetical protein